MLGGFAMQCAQSSRPASGAEHQFSHLWDMSRHQSNAAVQSWTDRRAVETTGRKAPSHGFQVGIGTLAVAGLYEYLLQRELEQLKIQTCAAQWPQVADVEDQIRDLFGPGRLCEIALKETKAKWITRAELRQQLETLQTVWPDLQRRLTEQLVPMVELKRRLRTVGAPAEPEEIGISRERLRESFRQAVFIRRRFTVLDVAVRCDLFEQALDHLFGPAGPWPIIQAQ